MGICVCIYVCMYICIFVYMYISRGANPQAQLGVVTITKKWIFQYKIAKKSKMLPKPFPKRVKWAKKCEKKSNSSPKRVKITPKS